MPKGIPKHRHRCNGMTIRVHPGGVMPASLTTAEDETSTTSMAQVTGSSVAPIHVEVKEVCTECGQFRTKAYDPKNVGELLELVRSFEWPYYVEPKKVEDRMRELEAQGFDVKPGAKVEEPKKRRGRPPKEQPKRRGRPPKDRGISTHPEDSR